MARFSIIALAASALVLSACGADRVIAQHHRPGIHSSFAYGGGGRDMTVVVIGNPFALPKDEVEQAITNAMQGSNVPPPTHFTTRPSAEARRDYRIVMLLDPPPAQNTYALCANASSLRPGPTGGRMRLLAAFCWGDRLMSEVAASVPAVASPQDPSFRRMVGRMTFELIPTSEPFDDDCARRPC